MNAKVRLLACTLSMAAAACGTHSGDSCTLSILGFGQGYVVCSEYFSTDNATPSQRAEGCAAGGGIYSSRSCPSENRIGRCFFAGQLARSYYAPMSLDDSQGDCASNGKLNQEPTFEAN